MGSKGSKGKRIIQFGKFESLRKRSCFISLIFKSFTQFSIFISVVV